MWATMKHGFTPVWIWEKDGLRRAVGDVTTAATWLVEHWPEDHRGTDAHVTAMQACVLALEGKGDAATVRALFVTAAREADMLAMD